MKAYQIPLPLFSESKLGKANFDSIQLSIALDADFLFAKFPFRNGRYKIYAFTIALGGMIDAKASEIVYPIATSIERRQSHYLMNVVKILDGSRPAYRFSVPGIFTSPTYLFYFDPNMPSDRFKLSNTLFLDSQNTSKLRLEYRGIFGVGKFMDLNRRFKINYSTVIARAVLIFSVVSSTVIGLCGFWLKQKIKLIKKIHIAKSDPKI